MQATIRFQFAVSDPIYRLDIDSAMWGYWENAGKPGTRPIRKRWDAPGEAALQRVGASYGLSGKRSRA